MDFKEDKEFKEIMLKYEFAKKKLETELDILLKEHEYKRNYNPVEHIKSRIKSLDSACNKLKKKKQEFSTYNLVKYVHDMIGFRIVCSFISDVYDIVNIIKSSNEFVIKEETDYIKNPKVSGYSSYHLNVLVPLHLEEITEYVEAEIQIRTVAMDCWASLEHKLDYKLPKKVPKEIKDELIACASDIDKLDLRMQKLYDIIKEYKDQIIYSIIFLRGDLFELYDG